MRWPTARNLALTAGGVGLVLLGGALLYPLVTAGHAGGEVGVTAVLAVVLGSRLIDAGRW